jgi:hypothetical protein
MFGFCQWTFTRYILSLYKRPSPKWTAANLITLHKVRNGIYLCSIKYSPHIKCHKKFVICHVADIYCRIPVSNYIQIYAVLVRWYMGQTDDHTWLSHKSGQVTGGNIHTYSISVVCITVSMWLSKYGDRLLHGFHTLHYSEGCHVRRQAFFN